MFEDIIKSIRAHLYERTTSPLLGTFIISWLAWNYRFVFVLFSELEVDFKFDYISAFIFYNSWACFSYGFLYPLLTTGFFIFVFPFPSKWVFIFWRNRQVELKKKRQQIDGEELLSKKESILIKKKLINLEREHAKEIDDRDREIAGLKEIIQTENKYEDNAKNIELDFPVSITASGPEEVHPEELSKETLAVFGMITVSDNHRVDEYALIERLMAVGHDQISARYQLDQMVEANLLQKEPHKERTGTRNYYSITAFGRAAIMDHRRHEAKKEKK